MYYALYYCDLNNHMTLSEIYKGKFEDIVELLTKEGRQPSAWYKLRSMSVVEVPSS